MSLFHAVVWLDSQAAQVLQFDAEHLEAQKVRAHSHPTAQHGSKVRTEHEFHAEICAALVGVTEVLVTASHQNQAAFRHYVEKHRPQVAARIVGYETVDHPTEAQLVGLARKYFQRRELMEGLPRVG